jgi:hypothetical protein
VMPPRPVFDELNHQRRPQDARLSRARD